MSIGDLKAWILCDCCNAEDEVEFPFVYAGPMHAEGMYDHRRPMLPHGWTTRGDDKHYCEECSQEEGK